MRQESNFDSDTNKRRILLTCTHEIGKQLRPRHTTLLLDLAICSSRPEPLPPTSITVTPNGPDSIEVSWGENENDGCAGSFEVCWTDGVHPIEQCQNVGGGGDNSLTIYDLLPCSEYDFIVTVVSPNGSFSSIGVTNSTSTSDVRKYFFFFYELLS